MKKSVLVASATTWAIVAITSGGVRTAAAPQAPGRATASAAEQRALIAQYCVGCHSEKLKTGGLVLEGLDPAHVEPNAEIWEKVVRKLRGNLMPPLGRPRPEEGAYDRLTAWLERELDKAAAANPNPGRVPAFHRVNRTEYHNAIRDLLGLEVDVAGFLPPDDSSYGFDNIGDILGISPTLLEGYLEAARKISKDAIGDPSIGRETYTYRLAGDLTQDYRLEGLPFGTRGGTVIRHHFPVDGEYEIKIDLLRNFIGGILGLAEAHRLEVSVDGERVELFTVGGRKPKPEPPAEQASQQQAARPMDAPADAGLLVKVAIKAGPRDVQVAFIHRTSAQVEDLRQPYLRSFASMSDLAAGMPHVSRVSITGPMNAAVGETPARRAILVCRPQKPAEEAPCAERILASLARRAYRRPVTDADLAPLMTFYESGRRGGTFETGIQHALQRLLMSPEFLVRIEHDPRSAKPGTNYRITDVALASRLSFFLWSSIPDEELLRLAERGRLKEPTILIQQVRRMLADERASALVNNFAGQWLYLRNVHVKSPDTLIFPDFDENLRLALKRETELLFDSVVHEDRSALDLIGARYTFVNERLAKHYGVPNIYGSHFRRVALAPDDPRGGLLGQGSILAVTSYPDRTSPVIRGKWILENILGTPPPPPPPNVPDLEPKNAAGRVLSMRDRMVQHRANPACAGCHAVMDPLGLALEPFDAIGRWRDASESGEAIDATGALPDGTPFNGPKELRRVLLREPDRFIHTLTEKLLTYALGRGVQYYDTPAVREIARRAARSNYRFSDLILGIVQSAPFQMRRTQS
jgi:hypothetical protein